MKERIEKILAVAGNTFKECVRHRILNVLLIFAAAMIGGSFLIRELAPGAEDRALIDTGLALTEIFGFLTVVLSLFITSYEEFEMRNIWITLTKPVSRGIFAAGKFAGICLTVTVNTLMMLSLLLLLARINSAAVNTSFIAAALGILLTLYVSAGFTMLFMLTATNLTTGTLFSVLFHLIGHLTQNLKTLIASPKTAAAVKFTASVFYYVLPDFAAFNFRDQIYLSGGVFHYPLLLKASAYGAFYALACLLIAGFAFSKKEL